MVILTLTINAQPSKRSELLSALRFFKKKIIAEEGCLDCHIYQDVDDENLINLKETWQHQSELDEHSCSDIFNALLGATKLLGKTYELHIDEGAQTEGKTTL